MSTQAQQRYQRESRIATGGMGEVWRATDTLLGRPVAVKILKHEYADDPGFRARFATEARHAASLHHPGIASVFDYGESEGTPFLVMELVEGRPLDALLRDGVPDAEVTRELVAQAAIALAEAHAVGLVHRDVKPANLLVTPDGRVKVTDFGIARAADDVGLTGTGQVLGTPHYLSPEQAEGRTATPASDVYSLGVVLFEALAGRRPFRADSAVATALAHVRDPVPDLPGHVPADLVAVTRRALAKDPGERYADAGAMARALRDAGTATVAAGLPMGAVAVAVDDVAPADHSSTRVLAPATRVVTGDPRISGAHGASGVAQADGRRRRAVPPWLKLAALGVLAVALVLALVLAGRGDPPTDPGSATSASPSAPASRAKAPSVQVRASDYLGRPGSEAVSRLQGLGLRTTTATRTNPGGRVPGNVAAVSPTGALTPGSTVTVTTFGAAPTPAPTSAPTTPAGTTGTGGSSTSGSTGSGTTITPEPTKPESTKKGGSEKTKDTTGKGKGKKDG